MKPARYVARRNIGAWVARPRIKIVKELRQVFKRKRLSMLDPRFCLQDIPGNFHGQLINVLVGQRVKQNRFHVALRPIPGVAHILDPLQKYRAYGGWSLRQLASRQ